jgi:cytochrome c-type biogenesis protein CcmH/NrfG
MYLNQERVDDAERILTTAHQIRPDDLEVTFQLARIARARQHFRMRPRGCLERVVANKPDHTRAHVLLAQTYFRLKRTAEGTREREIVRKLNEEEQARHVKATGASRIPADNQRWGAETLGWR